ncbi:MAG: 2,4-dihydroxyhept-2-ene-1,7-dioic acid aldolase [Alphaproteobacteria bacterium]|nr:2,4-dihydroxyhept-2-ene-1,7-dioic acid aldolase [Alphaproteobacteria bacterium]MBV9420728.1 2,4-dihydroxyhept-2-ene-1,7-dioic acid aldolase [Alphaproteobacteria bacterium]
MRPNRLREMWAQGRGATNVWLSLGGILSTEIIAHQGWDSLTVDMQHGQADFAGMVQMLTAISTTATVPLVRIPSYDFGDINRVLDAGAYGVICPNVDTAEQAERFASACRYAPRGTRSVGPRRAVLYGGNDYLVKANETILTMAQVESAIALKNVHEIAAVKELDVLFIGPSDLGLSLGRQPLADQTDPVVVKAIDEILAAAKAAGKHAAIYCRSVEYSKQMLAKGFDLVVVTSDDALISSGAAWAAQFR